MKTWNCCSSCSCYCCSSCEPPTFVVERSFLPPSVYEPLINFIPAEGLTQTNQGNTKPQRPYYSGQAFLPILPVLFCGRNTVNRRYLLVLWSEECWKDLVVKYWHIGQFVGFTESAENLEEKHLHKQGIIQEGPDLEHQGLLGDLWDIRLEEHIVSDSGGLKLGCISGNRRHKDGRKPGNGDTVDRTYSMKETG